MHGSPKADIWHNVAMAAIGAFCGSSSGSNPGFRRAAAALGAAVAVGDHQLVYGGGDVGLMGAVADAAIGRGGQVTGVMTEHLVAAEVSHDGLTTLEIVGSMHERKARMVALSDGIVVLPGGFGTMDEAFEVITWNQLGLISIPVVFLDVDGYFAALFSFIAKSVEAGFVRGRHAGIAQLTSSPEEAIDIATGPPRAYSPKWIG